VDTLLTFFVALTALAVMAQACVLVAIYLMSKRLSNQIERFMSETRQMMVPVKAITENLQIASTNIMEIGVSAREQFRRVEGMVADTGDVLNAQLSRLEEVTKDVADRINSTADMVQSTVIRPVREVAAVARGFGKGIDFLFRRNRKSANSRSEDDERFT
jgi:cytochrome bd-type quinol oxidase subunit 2